MRGMIQRVRAIAALEGDGFDRLFSRGRWIVPAAALSLGLVFGLLRPGITFMYSSSALFLMLCLAAGTLGRTAAAAFVGGFVAGDAVWYVTSGAFALSARSKIGGQFDMGLGRITAWILAWLLASAIPLLARRAGAAAITSLPKLRGVRGSTANLVVAIIGAPVLVATAYAFLQLMAYLIPPAFPLRDPPVLLISPLQLAALRVGLVGAVVFVLVELLLRSRMGRLADLVDVAPDLAENTLAGFAARAAAFGLAMVLFRNLLITPRDIATLVGAFLVGEAGAFALRRSAMSRWVARVPWIVRVMAASGLAAVTVHKVFTATFTYGPPTPFWPMVIAAAVGFVLFRVLLAGQDEAPGSSVAGRDQPVGAPGIPLAVLAFGAVLAGNLAAPDVLWADNCNDMADCAQGAMAAMWAAAVAAAGFLWEAIKAAFSKVPPVISDLEPLASEDGAAAEGGEMDALQALVARRADAGGTDENPNPGQAIRSMSRADFYKAAKNGDFAGLGVAPW